MFNTYEDRVCRTSPGVWYHLSRQNSESKYKWSTASQIVSDTHMKYKIRALLQFAAVDQSIASRWDCWDFLRAAENGYSEKNCSLTAKKKKLQVKKKRRKQMRQMNNFVLVTETKRLQFLLEVENCVYKAISSKHFNVPVIMALGIHFSSFIGAFLEGKVQTGKIKNPG